METNTNPNNIQTQVDEVVTQEDYTPYQAAGVVSKLVGRRVREQMLYNYVGKGYIPSTFGTRETNKGSREVRVILKEDLKVWLVKFLTKNIPTS